MDLHAESPLPPNPVEVSEVVEFCAKDLRSKLEEIGRLDQQCAEIANEPCEAEQPTRLLEISRVKVELANQGYEAVERCIREIDQNLQSAESVIRSRLFSLRGVASVRKTSNDVSQTDDDVAKSVDEYPSEPVYCTCRKVQFGNMIACDDDSCTIEWYHYDCVGLKTAPKGKWYCPICRAKRSAATPTAASTPGSARGRRRRIS